MYNKTLELEWDLLVEKPVKNHFVLGWTVKVSRGLEELRLKQFLL